MAVCSVNMHTPLKGFEGASNRSPKNNIHSVQHKMHDSYITLGHETFTVKDTHLQSVCMLIYKLLCECKGEGVDTGVLQSYQVII